jgi:hypothetical protein
MEFVFAQQDSSLTPQDNVHHVKLDVLYVIQTQHALNVFLHWLYKPIHVLVHVVVDSIFLELFVLDALQIVMDALQPINVIIVTLDFIYSKVVAMLHVHLEQLLTMPLSNVLHVIVLAEHV